LPEVASPPPPPPVVPPSTEEEENVLGGTFGGAPGPLPPPPSAVEYKTEKVENLDLPLRLCGTLLTHTLTSECLPLSVENAAAVAVAVAAEKNADVVEGAPVVVLVLAVTSKALRMTCRCEVRRRDIAIAKK
jgi:hypothetical protein